jgi:ABC-type transport system involved in Fe-S cluster assembly fused permease/ATPase subunit
MFQLLDVKNNVVDKKNAKKLKKSLGNIKFKNVEF